MIPRLNFQLGKEWEVSYPIDPTVAGVLLNPETKEIKYVSIPANGLDRGLVAQLWDTITLTPLQQEVLVSLRIIAPGTEGINIVGDRESSNGIIPIIKVAEIDEPLPLNSLGDGMQRILGIILALVNAKDGMVMIDEIENSIHYSVQHELWQVIFQLAHRLNVQVFATTHSWDCIEGFQKAAKENTEEEGMLIRLSLLGDDVITTLFNERKLGIATRQQIEVR